jgi:hypothetical protein
MGASGEHLINHPFDAWLEDELAREFVRFSEVPLPQGAPYRADFSLRISRRLAAKTVVLIAAAAVALAGTTALAAVTGSANPQVWGQYVEDVVTTCKSQLETGQHGIGGCVSVIARQKGAQQRDEHSNGQGNGQKKHEVPANSPQR